MGSFLSINTNVASLNTQRNLARNTQGLQRVFERLSSGLRITRASDDAAGLSIASALQADNRVYTQGIRNANDGISQLSIAEGSIEQLKTIVTRVRELSTQAANGTLGATQRQALNTEAAALSAEYNRILAATTFNGVNLFDVAYGSFTVQLGYGDDESIRAILTSGTLTSDPIRASLTSGGAEGNGSSDSVAMSADGRYIAFTSSATNFVSGDTNGVADVFLRDTVTGLTQLVSRSSSGVQANAQNYGIAISADGRYVSFTSSATNLVTGDTNGADDLFVFDAQTGTTRRASVGTGGTQANGYALQGSISADGRYVAYSSSASNLVSGDTNAVDD
ncbi:MAG: PD40 domain-containing protein, partial [Deltaproteobacteria bacterium]|nr:PD40 domain-containing protein [Deltaproteobacteria bacterium]